MDKSAFRNVWMSKIAAKPRFEAAEITHIRRVLMRYEMTTTLAPEEAIAAAEQF